MVLSFECGCQVYRKSFLSSVQVKYLINTVDVQNFTAHRLLILQLDLEHENHKN